MARGGSFVPAQSDSGEILSLRPIGPGGVDLFTDPSLLDPSVLRRSENIRLARGVLERRKGALRLAQFSDVSNSHTFGTDAKYATIPAAAQLVIPAGGFAILAHFTAVWPAATKTAYILSSRPSGQTWHQLTIFLTDAGVIKTQWQDSGGVERSVAATAVANGARVDLLSIFDAFAGTFTTYVNGAVSGAPVTGLSATLKPDQTSGVIWAVGVEKQTSAAVTVDTHFDGAFDGFTLFTLRGTRPSQGSTTLVNTLRRHSGRTWPSPEMDMVLAHYDADEASGTTMYDRSRFKNHGTYTGSPTVTAPVAMLSAPCNYVGRFGTSTGARYNLIGSYGRAFYEITATGA